MYYIYTHIYIYIFSCNKQIKSSIYIYHKCFIIITYISLIIILGPLGKPDCIYVATAQQYIEGPFKHFNTGGGSTERILKPNLGSSSSASLGI